MVPRQTASAGDRGASIPSPPARPTDTSPESTTALTSTAGTHRRQRRRTDCIPTIVPALRRAKLGQVLRPANQSYPQHADQHDQVPPLRRFHAPLVGRQVLRWYPDSLSLVGVQFISIGLLGELLTRTSVESQGKPAYMVGTTLNLERRDEKRTVA